MAPDGFRWLLMASDGSRGLQMASDGFDRKLWQIDCIPFEHNVPTDQCLLISSSFTGFVDPSSCLLVFLSHGCCRR